MCGVWDAFLHAAAWHGRHCHSHFTVSVTRITVTVTKRVCVNNCLLARYIACVRHNSRERCDRERRSESVRGAGLESHGRCRCRSGHLGHLRPPVTATHLPHKGYVSPDSRPVRISAQNTSAFYTYLLLRVFFIYVLLFVYLQPVSSLDTEKNN